MKFLFIAISLFISWSLTAQEVFDVDRMIREDSIEFLIPTFRGSVERNFYGLGETNRLDVIWKFNLGQGITIIGRKTGKRLWKGAGWTGQALMVREGSDTFLIQGAYDHHLRKIKADSGIEVWKYKFDDVVKGTGTLFLNRKAESKENAVLVLQGSRLGTNHYFDADHVPSFRAVSYYTGKELWRMDSRRTRSYSRDVDASALIIADTAYIGLENGIFTAFNPAPENADSLEGMFQPERYSNHILFNTADAKVHGGNLVTESSPAFLGNRIYVASGSGHVFGYNMEKDSIDWDFYTGSDMDGSVVITRDSCLLVSVEKQYIKGKGGVFKLDPSMEPSKSVLWYLPVRDTSYADWEGGVIGTAAVNDYYIGEDEDPLMAVSALDGYTYIVRHKSIDQGKFVAGPSGKGNFPTPVIVRKIRTAPSIASPVLTANRLIICGYNGIYLYSYLGKDFKLLDRLGVAVESSPVIWGRRIYIASRNGYLYCLGEKQLN